MIPLNELLKPIKKTSFNTKEKRANSRTQPTIPKGGASYQRPAVMKQQKAKIGGEEGGKGGFA
ncbi:MAG: hypothetical protein CV045_07390 [Cyanobacteria bacterium M5B4]|nr:MAG: hypothetical protein CV045_07390 [Cyanobacteria bacterium M5B4]